MCIVPEAKRGRCIEPSHFCLLLPALLSFFRFYLVFGPLFMSRASYRRQACTMLCGYCSCAMLEKWARPNVSYGNRVANSDLSIVFLMNASDMSLSVPRALRVVDAALICFFLPYLCDRVLRNVPHYRAGLARPSFDSLDMFHFGHVLEPQQRFHTRPKLLGESTMDILRNCWWLTSSIFKDLTRSYVALIAVFEN